MAYKKKGKAVQSEGEANPKKKKLEQIRERDKAAREADRDNRVKALEDIKFVHVPLSQWEDSIRTERGLRPCYEYNKTRVTIKRVVNDMRANRPQAKIRGTEEGDKDTAEVLEGLFRNIWNVSDGDTVIDAAAEYQVGGGMGAWRVSVDYAGDGAFDQDIKIEEIRNPFCLYPDPACQDPLKRDARYWILTSRITKSAFEARWPKADMSDFDTDTEFDDEDDWEDADSVRIVEYWYKEPVDETIYLLEDGKTVNELPPGSVPIKVRKLKSNKIRMCIASGKAILEEADWAGSQFPFVIVYGESVIIDGKHHWFGLTRFAKDAAKSYNYAMTSIIETVALSPQAKWWATPKQAEGHVDKWNVAHKELIPFMLYNPDEKAPGNPQQMLAPQVPAALMNIAQMASEDIKAVTGIFDASLGKQANETSGVAIKARQQQGEIAVFNYMDNLAKGIRRTAEIVVDLIPKIYDTARAVRILGVDGAEKYVKVNAPGPNGETINDLSRGKYDVTVTVGPSFSTQRQEAAETYFNMAKGDPMLAQIAGDLMYKALDVPYSDEIAERYKMMLPPQISQGLSEGKELPPEAQQALMQAQQAMQMVNEQAALVQEEASKVEGEKSNLVKQIAQLQIKEANMKADFESLSAALTKQEAQLILKQAQAGVDKDNQEVEGDRAALSSQVTEAVAQLQAQSAEFMTQAAQVITQIQATAQPQVFMQNPPRRKVGRTRRINGELITEIEEVPMEAA